jgi:hypothetical protein
VQGGVEVTYGFFEIYHMIEGVKKVYNSRPFWQEKAREDLLTTIFPPSDISAKVDRMTYEGWEADKKRRQAMPMRAKGAITVTGNEPMFTKA